MQVTETVSEGLKREYTIVVDAKDIDEKINSKLAMLSEQVQLPGFRPGKVPVGLLKKRFGASVTGEVLEETVTASSQQTLDERELRPATQPNIEITKFEEGTDLEYKMSVEIMPDFEPMDFSKLELERLKVEVSDDEVDAALKQMAEHQKSFAKVARNRKSKEGDALLIDFVGKVGGEAFEGGSGEDFQLELGSNTFIPGFEDQLVGAKGGDHVEVKVTFPEEYGAEELAGKEAVFEVDVKEVREPAAAAVDDDFATKMGLENLQALRDAIRPQLEQETNSLSRARMKRTLLDKLEEGHDFAVPEGMVNSEFEAIWNQIEEQRKNSGVADEEDVGKSDDELKEDYRAIAERRVRLGLILAEVGRANNIEIQQDELQRAIIEQARNYPGQERQVMEFYEKNPQMVDQLRAPIFEDKVVDFIVEMAKVTDKSVTREELMKDPDDEAEKKPKKKAKTAKSGAKKTTAKSAKSKAKKDSTDKETD